MENDTPNKIKISKEIIATLPIETFPGKIVVIDNERDADNAVLQLNNERIIGFDTETRPTFKKGKSISGLILEGILQSTFSKIHMN